MKKLHNQILLAFLLPMIPLMGFAIYMSINVYLEFKGLILDTSHQLFLYETK
jgi:hypothetical protein